MWTMRETYRFVKDPTGELQLKIRTHGFVVDGSAAKIFGDAAVYGEDYHKIDRRYHRYARWLAWWVGLPQYYAPWLAMGIVKRWNTDSAILDRHQLYSLAIDTYYRWVMSRYVTCPECHRPNRTLTSKGRVRLHNISVNRGNPGYRKPCPMSGEVYVQPEEDIAS